MAYARIQNTVSGLTVAFVFYNATDQAWNGSAYETWVDGNYATYAVAATEIGTSARYRVAIPAGVVTAGYDDIVARSATLGGSIYGSLGQGTVVTFSQAAAATSTAPISSGGLSAKRGDTFSTSITGLGSLTGRTKLWFTVKSGLISDNDTDSIIQIEESGGLLYLNGAAYGTASDGSLTVTDANAGDVTITLKPAASKLLPIGTYHYDVQVLNTIVTTLAEGDFVTVVDVTRAVS